MGKYNYTGKTVYVGIDVHKKTYACVSICEGEIVKKDTMPAKPTGLTSYIINQFSGANVETAYEAGFSGFHLHRELINAGINNKVINPGSIEIASRDRVKTDKRDAKKIATQLAAGRLEGIYIPGVEQEAKRSASRFRDNMVKFRQQTGQKIKSLLFTQGLIEADDDSTISKKWLLAMVVQVKELNYPTGFYYTLNKYVELWLHLNEKLKEIERELSDMQSEEEKALMAIYQSAPGIGETFALKLKDELGDMQQFSTEKKLFNYLGFTPSEYSSGEHVRQGHISRQGRAKLRHIFVEAAWIAITKDKDLLDSFKQVANRRGKKRAIVAVARRLAGRLRSCIKNGVFYEIKPLQADTVNAKKELCVTS